jgi:hypothetical protein
MTAPAPTVTPEVAEAFRLFWNAETPEEIADAWFIYQQTIKEQKAHEYRSLGRK